MAAVRELRPGDEAAWLEMRVALWPDGSEAEHREEIRDFLAGERPRWPWTVLVAEDEGGTCVGFAEVSERTYAQGCVGTRVGYLEGWFVRRGTRERGVGRALVEAAESWARDRGCAEFASDADPENEISRVAHVAVGFEDVGLVRCFRKQIGPRAIDG